ncbi:succinate dehydrogenase cytochrome b558 subunit [Rhodopirellula sp. MGV]|uniref:succinate dehydrogenase cytochrome b558 subunit n=1 Tax=Rhodopirellula sp. MGV TaxID=2023130 RepID=UPI000B96556B|nr:succinate dehydrogenase cytochrome b558 subunit [Rhodopirellula sp. MGV]OYP28841.1 succinate dehydrogenase [Rhodopirellula sp. MGV]PNY37560.1 succinate dehydrogenase [Rhodopirellula baltica]
MSDSPSETKVSFFEKHEFAIRRIHSLLGIVPLGLYMVVHLTTNASLLNGVETFQRAVFMIHSPGKLLPLIEWAFIFAPLLFHAILGVWIAKTGRTNSGQYRFASNKRYSWQRWTGMIGLVYLFLHIMHLHGGFHAQWWINSINGIGFGMFSPYNAGSSLVRAMDWGWGVVWPTIYLVGMLSLVYHLANGLWTAGITWGLWISPAAQARATKVCVAFGIVLTVISLSAWAGAVIPGEEDAQAMEAIENRMYEAGVEAGMVPENEEKRAHHSATDVEAGEEAVSDTEATAMTEFVPAS